MLFFVCLYYYLFVPDPKRHTWNKRDIIQSIFAESAVKYQPTNLWAYYQTGEGVWSRRLAPSTPTCGASIHVDSAVAGLEPKLCNGSRHCVLIRHLMSRDQYSGSTDWGESVIYDDADRPMSCCRNCGLTEERNHSECAHLWLRRWRMRKNSSSRSATHALRVTCNWQWFGLRTSVLGQDRSENKKIGLGLVILVLIIPWSWS